MNVAELNLFLIPQFVNFIAIPGETDRMKNVKILFTDI